jgi:hypothetical protein
MKILVILILTIFCQSAIKSKVFLYKTQGGSTCDVKSYPKVDFPTDKSTVVAKKLGDLASHIANGIGVTKTTYTYDVKIDGKKGIFYTDCSCFVGFVVYSISPAHFNEIPKDSCVKPPAARANMWSGYFAGPAANGKSKNWVSITKVEQAQHGDVLAWGFPVDKNCNILGGHSDTGHVMVIVNGPKGEKPVTIDNNWATVWVADGSNLRHLKGSDMGARYSKLAVVNKVGPSKTAGGPENTGVGFGQIKLNLNSNGEANGTFIIQTKQVVGAQIGIGRAAN